MSIARKLRLSLWIILAVAVVANAVLFGGRLTAWVADHSGRWLAPVAQLMMHARARMSDVFSRNDLAAENEALRQQLMQTRAQLAGQDELQRQLEFYRAAAGIREHTGGDPIEAGIFSYPQGSGVSQIIVNRGSVDWVAVNDVVVTPEGALVGIVERVRDRQAVVRIIGDSALEMTVRILGTDISGILRADGSGSTMIDLVQKEESVPEGAVVVTSGDDLYPAGLVVGTVRSVDNDAATLFKIVRVTPAITGNISGRVVIIRP